MKKITLTIYSEEYDDVIDIEVDGMTKSEVIDFMSDKNENAFALDFGESMLIDYDEHLLDDEFAYYLDNNSNTIVEIH